MSVSVLQQDSSKNNLTLFLWLQHAWILNTDKLVLIFREGTVKIKMLEREFLMGLAVLAPRERYREIRQRKCVFYGAD